MSAGTTLVQLDTVDEALGLAGAEAARRLAEVQLRELTVLDDRLSDTTVRWERHVAARARSGLDAADVALARARLALERRRVRAPFGGRVADVVAVPGGWANAGAPLLSVVTLSPIGVQVQVLETDLPEVAVGSRAVVTFPALRELRFVGRVESINPTVAPETRAARVTVRLPNPGGRILPGMYARVSIDGRPLRDRILVPRAAVLERDRRTVVFVYQPGEGHGLAKWRYVSIGAGNEQLVEVRADGTEPGVHPGELVLVEGHATLTHDAPVRVVAGGDSSGRTIQSVSAGPAR